MRKSIKKIAASIAACTMVMAVLAGTAPATVSAAVKSSKEGEKAGKADFNPDGEYHAYLEFQQSDSWVFRNSWIDPDLGLTGEKLEGDMSFDKMMQSVDGKTEVVDGTLTDAVIDGNGTYTVQVDGLDVSKLDPDATKVALFGVSTDIPIKAVEDGSITISDVTWAVDGVDKGSVEPYINADTKDWGLYQFEIVNTYQQDGYTNPGMQIPANGGLSVTFTVSGMSKDSATANAGASSEATSDPSAADGTSAGNTSEAKSGVSVPLVAGIVVAVVVVAGVVIVVAKKKKN